MSSVPVTREASASKSRVAIPRAMRSTGFYVLLVVVGMFLVFGIITPEHRFLNLENIFSIGLDGAGLLLLAVAMSYVLGNGNLDLSIGSNLVLSSVVSAKVILALSGPSTKVAEGVYQHQALAITLGVLAGVASGMLAGLANGLLVTRLRVNSFVVTLGTNGVLTGIALVVTNGSNIANLPTSLQTDFGAMTLWKVPLPLILAVILGVAAWVLLRVSAFGTHAMAVGSSSPAAGRSGVSVSSVVVRVFILAGFMAGMAGVLDITKFGTTAVTGHENDALQAISAAIIGGTSLFGGRASIGGAMIAAFIPTTLLSGFVMMNLAPFYQYIAVGAILVAAVYIDGVRRGRL